MPAPRKPDRELQAAMAEARKRKAEAYATFDRQVKRLHNVGECVEAIARELKASKTKMEGSLARLKLTPHKVVDVLFQGPRYG